MRKKICSTCKELKSRECFHANSAQYDGLHNECKHCRAIARGAVERSNLPQKRAVKKTIVITSAEVGVEPIRRYLRTLECFCEHNNAELFILGMREQAKPLQSQSSYYSKSIAKYICRKVFINNNLYAEDLELTPQQIEPLSGLQKFGSKTGRQSVIIAHSKQHLLTLGSLTSPRIHASTGCITPPKYLENTRSGRIAEIDHFNGGFIIDIIDDDTFILQNFKFSEDGSITNYGERYHSNSKITRDECKAIICGDWHIDSMINISNYSILSEQCGFFNNTASLVFHDLNSWNLTSHHNKGNTLLSDKSLYMNDIYELKRFIGKCKKLSKEIIVVKSNHDDHLANYMKAGNFSDAGINLQTICEHTADYVRTGSVFTYIDESIVYVSAKDDYKIAGCTLSLHGHKASAGKKGSLKTIEQDVPNCIIAHSHSPAIRNDAMQAGYNGSKQEYAQDSASNWLQANCFLFESGFKQLCISVNGRWLPERIKL